MKLQFDISSRAKVSRNYKIKYLLFCVFAFSMVATLTFFLFKYLKPSHAIDFSNFKPGNIISDNTMSDTGTMDEVSIQKFLTKANPCNDFNTSKAANYPAYKYHIEDGHFICLSQEIFENNGVKQTAAQIIFEASRDYAINPQVLIVLLEKEQGLITDTWPNHIQYRSATGFGCPDTAECDAKYYGFKNQVRNAAKLFREVLDGGYTNYPIGNNFVLYNPNRSCGGSVVNIENLATSALYRYTPYQPNQAALANYPGTSYCGAYGNRNFFALFQKWFGDPRNTYSVPSSAYILDGEYRIASLANTYLSNETNNHDSQNLILKITHNKEKTFILKRTGNGLYNIIDPKTQKGLNVVGNVLKFDNIKNKDCSYEWSIEPKSENYELHSSCYDKSLDIENGNINTEGNLVWIYQSNGTNAQKWKLESINNTGEKVQDKSIYNIISSSNKAIDAVNIGTANGTELQTYINADNQAQRFKLEETIDGFYSIKNINANKLVDVQDASKNEGAKIQLYDSNNTCAQKWFLKKDGSYYNIHSSCSGRVIDSDQFNFDGSRIKLFSKYNNKVSQQWKLQLSKVNEVQNDSILQDGVYSISSSLDKTKVLDADHYGLTNGANISLYQKWGTDNKAQKWNIKKLDDGYYLISNFGTGRAMDVYYGEIKDRSNIWVYDVNLTCAQKWKLSKNSDNSYSFLSACNEEMSLDVENGLSFNGVNVQLYQKWGTDNKAQKWYIEPIV